MTVSEAAAASPPPAGAGGRSAVGTEALAQGLLLVRASAINLVRLQLAMERRDRRLALETVDELMVLDRRLGDFVGGLSELSSPLSAEAHALEHRHRALAVERLILTSGASGPRIVTPLNDWVPPPPSIDIHASEPVAEGQAQDEADLADEPREISIRLVVAGLMLVAILAGAAAFFLFTEVGDTLIAGSVLHQGAQ